MKKRCSAVCISKPNRKCRNTSCNGHEHGFCASHLKKNDGKHPPECVCCFRLVDKHEEYVPRCGHVIHSKCIQKWIDNQATLEKSCPTCRYLISPIEINMIHPRHALKVFVDSSLSHIKGQDICWHISTVENAREMIPMIETFLKDDEFQSFNGPFSFRTKSTLFDLSDCSSRPYNELLLLQENLNRFMNNYTRMEENVKVIEGIEMLYVSS